MFSNYKDSLRTGGWANISTCLNLACLHFQCVTCMIQGWCSIGHVSRYHPKIKSRKILSAHNVSLICQIVVKLDDIVLYAKRPKSDNSHGYYGPTMSCASSISFSTKNDALCAFTIFGCEIMQWNVWLGILLIRLVRCPFILVKASQDHVPMDKI